MNSFTQVAANRCGWAMAVLGWDAMTAWRATPQEVHAAHAAYLLWHGLTSLSPPCDQHSLSILKERFPDDGNSAG
jgi:hypothetical protein